jgi:hypothetical protein
MLRRNFIVVIAVAALLCSGLALALQVQQRRAANKFDRYMKPAAFTDFDRRILLARVEMLESAADIDRGTWAPQIWGLTPDHRKILVRVNVDPKDLPKDYDGRMRIFGVLAGRATGSIMAAFQNEVTAADVRVEFVDFAWLTKGRVEPGHIIAHFENGQFAIN